LLAHGSKAIALDANVPDADAVKSIAEWVVTFGRIGVWISNVGVGAVGSQETQMEAHEEVIRARLIGDAHAVLPSFSSRAKASSST
jgi:NAD(P)-dependent dehydrogenase (short-subunit alcohol dehydrogenase family)